MLKLLKASGHSMEPEIASGSFVVVFTWAYKFFAPRIGEIVVFASPHDPEKLFCKRIVKVHTAAAEVTVTGDNIHDSYDSKNFGPIKFKQIIGKVIYATGPRPDRISG